MMIQLFVKVILAALVFATVALISVIGHAQIPTRTANWVNIKDPQFGAMGNGNHDDTAAIQAAIDYAFARKLTGVYCPAGNYRTSSTLYLDPPGNLRPFTFSGYISGTTLTVTAAPPAGSLYVDSSGGTVITGSGVAANTTITAYGTGSGGVGTYTLNNSQTAGSAGAPITLTGSNFSNPTQFQFTMALFGDPSGGGWAHINGCQLLPNFNNATALMVGTGSSMRVSDISVIGPGGGYRGQQPSGGVGIGLAGGSGGSSVNLVENTHVENFYALYKTDANGGCCLADSNTFRSAGGLNGYYGIYLAGAQTYIDHIYNPDIIGTTIGVEANSHQTEIIGGNISAGSGKVNTFSLTNVSNNLGVCPTGAPIGGGCINATIVSPDQYVGSVYNSYIIQTAHSGMIPVVLASWNPTTNAAVFYFWPPWFYANYGTTSTASLQADTAAATSVYAIERVTVFEGPGIDDDGTHVENPNVCTTFYWLYSPWGAALSASLKNPYFNYFFDLTNQAGADVRNIYCQQTYPFLGSEGSPNYGWPSPVFTISIEGGDWGAQYQPVVIDMPDWLSLKGSQLSGAMFNIRVFNTHGNFPYGQLDSQGTFSNEARGGGEWDNDYFLPLAQRGDQQYLGDIKSPFCGYEPCPWTTPNLSPTLYAKVSGSLGALGTYPPIACRTVFKSVDWNTGAITPPSTAGGGIFKRSASCPGYSWGQNLTNSTVGGTVTWSYMAGSDVLYLDASTLKWMFPGLGFSINNGNGPQPYIVTGVYPYLGYVTVIWAGATSGAPLQGTAGTVYSCSSGCTIGQAPFSWTAY